MAATWGAMDGQDGRSGNGRKDKEVIRERRMAWLVLVVGGPGGKPVPWEDLLLWNKRERKDLGF